MKKLLSVCLIFFCGCADFRYTPPSGPIFVSEGHEPSKVKEFEHDERRHNAYAYRNRNYDEYRDKAISITGLTDLGEPNDLSKKAIERVRSLFAREGYQIVESNAPLEIHVWVQSSISETPTLFSSKTNVRLKLFIKARNRFGPIFLKDYKGHYKEEDLDQNTVIDKALDEAIRGMMIDAEFMELLKK